MLIRSTISAPDHSGEVTVQHAKNRLQQTVSDNRWPYDPDVAFESSCGREVAQIDEVKFGGKYRDEPLTIKKAVDTFTPTSMMEGGSCRKGNWVS